MQVIIPYTSEYTPIPFQQSYGDWSVRNNPEKTQPRKVPPVHDTSIDNYVQQESKNEIQLINHLQSEYNFNNSNKLNTRVSLTSEIDARPTTTKANNSIDVRRLQKNIDNWTIQVSLNEHLYYERTLLYYLAILLYNSICRLEVFCYCCAK